MAIILSQAKPVFRSKIIPFEFTRGFRAIGTTMHGGRTYLVATDKSNIVERLFGPESGSKLALAQDPQTGSLGENEFYLKVTHARAGKSDYYRFFRLKPNERKELSAALNFGRSEYSDSMGRS